MGERDYAAAEEQNEGEVGSDGGGDEGDGGAKRLVGPPLEGFDDRVFHQQPAQLPLHPSRHSPPFHGLLFSAAPPSGLSVERDLDVRTYSCSTPITQN